MSEKTILRVQYDGKKGWYKVVAKTTEGCGGWKNLATAVSCKNKQDCEKYLDDLVLLWPDLYEKEP